MSKLSIYLIILFMLAILATIFVIQYLREKSFKNALGLLIIMVLTTLFSVCINEIVARFNSETPIIEQSGSFKTDQSNQGKTEQDFDDQELEGDESITGTEIKSIGDFLYFLSPMARKLFQKRNKTYFPDWLLILVTILGHIALIGGPISENNVKLKTFTLPRVILSVILIPINLYAIFFFSMISSAFEPCGNTVLDILIAICLYYAMLLMIMLLFGAELGLIIDLCYNNTTHSHDMFD